MAKTTKEERGTRRYNVRNFELYCSEGGFFSQLFGQKRGNKLPVVNFSVGGAQFLADKKFTEGEKVRINLYVPATPEAVQIDAQVCWCQQVPRRGAFRVGVRFSSSARKRSGELQEIEAKIGSLTIRLLCPKCKSALSVKKKYEGSQARCPKCKTPISVADPESLPELVSEKKQSGVAPKDGSSARASYASLRPAFVHFLRSTIRSRMHLDVVKTFAKTERGQVAGSSELAVQFKVSERKMREALRELVNRGVLKEIGVKTFNYDPTPDVRRHLAELASSLGNAGKRSEVLAVVLEAEKKKKR
jgi:DNA-directed RNA polymerase subunit M/transcription elongation factor TFIIS/Tfp pilus assembly protein PilZ